MQHTHHLNAIPVDAIDHGVRVYADHFVAGPLAYAFGSDQRIEPNAFRGSLYGSENPVGGNEAELCVVCLDGGDISYRPG